MTMTAKEYLRRAYKLNEEIDQLEAAKHKMFSRITSITPKYNSDTVSGTKDPHKYDAYAQFAAEIDNRVDELVSIKSDILNTIKKVEDAKLRTLLIARYINFMTFEGIAVMMNYDWRHVMRLHSDGLKAVEEVLKMS